MGHFFRRDGAADPRCLRGVPLGGQRPPEPENFCIFDFRGGPLRPPEGQNWPTLDPKNFPNWAGINSFLAGFKFLWAGFFWARIWSLGQTSDLKIDPFLAIFRPFHTSKMTRMSYFGWFFAHFWPWMTQENHHKIESHHVCVKIMLIQLTGKYQLVTCNYQYVTGK